MNKYCYNATINMQEYKRAFYYKNIEVLFLSIKYPIISMKNNTQSEWLINNQIAMNVNDYIKHADYLYEQAIDSYNDSLTNDYPFHGYEAYMEYTITYNENCFLSMFNDKYEFTGGAHGNTVRSSTTWELCCGMIIPIYGFFKPGTNYTQFIIDEITKQADYNMIQKKEGIYFDDYKSLIVKNLNLNSFYLSTKGLTIYYQQYDIAPYSTGIVEFTIPYKTIGWYPSC